MVKKEVIAALIDQKKAAVLKIVLNSREEMYLKEIAGKSDVSITSTFRILQELVNLGILRKREWKTSKVYSCENNDKVSFLKDLFIEEYDGIKEFVEVAKNIQGIQEILLHGPKKKNKANILLIGDDINTDKIEEVCVKIRENGFDLSYLTLKENQYQQMAKMGLYSGEKKILKS